MANETPERPGLSRRARLALLAPLLAAYAGLAWRFRFVTDDAYISFRYARNLARGLGLRYNPGDEAPVEGYSNFLWVLVGATFEALGLDQVRWLPLLSAACGALLVAWCWDLLARRLALPLRAALPAALGLAVFAPFDVWATGGLATLPFALALVLSLDELCLRRPVRLAPAALATTTLVLVRVEGFLWLAALLVLTGIVRRNERGALRPILLATALTASLLAAHLWMRSAVYGALLPATFAAKSGQPLAYLGRGVDYVATWYLAFLSPLALVPATFVALRPRWRRVGLPLVAAAWGFPLYAVATTGDFMTMGRFLVPGAPLVAAATGLWLARLPAAGAWSVGLALAVLGALPGLDVHLVPASIRERFRFRYNTVEFRDEVDQWRFQRDNARRWGEWGRALGAYARAELGPGASVVLDTIGAAGYRSDLFVHDQFGLVTREVAELPVEEDAPMASPGHDRLVRNDFFAEERPSILFSQVLEQSDPRAAAGVMAGFAERLASGAVLPGAPARGGWAPDFRRLEDEPARYLFVWRAAEGEERAALEAEFRREVARLANGGPVRTLALRARPNAD